MTRALTKRRQIVDQVRQARVALGGRRLVVGRRAADGERDVAVVEDEAVVAGGRGGLVGEAGAMECAVKPFAGAIAGEGAAGAVGAVGAGRETADEQPGGGIAEARDGTRPVGLVGVGGALVAGDRGAPVDQARAATAGDDARVLRRQRRRRGDRPTRRSRTPRASPGRWASTRWAWSARWRFAAASWSDPWASTRRASFGPWASTRRAALGRVGFRGGAVRRTADGGCGGRRAVTAGAACSRASERSRRTWRRAVCSAARAPPRIDSPSASSSTSKSISPAMRASERRSSAGVVDDGFGQEAQRARRVADAGVADDEQAPLGPVQRDLAGRLAGGGDDRERADAIAGRQQIVDGDALDRGRRRHRRRAPTRARRSVRERGRRRDSDCDWSAGCGRRLPASAPRGRRRRARPGRCTGCRRRDARRSRGSRSRSGRKTRSTWRCRGRCRA